MVHSLLENFKIRKYGLFIRLVNETDASFILKLRTNSTRNQYIHSINNDIELQVQWLRNYKEREKMVKEFYFLVCNEHLVPQGTTRIYNFSDDTFETGSWVFMSDVPFGMAILGDIIGREVAFENLGFSKCKFEVRKANKSVLNYHYKYEPKLVGEDDLNFYFELDKERFYYYSNKLLKVLGYANR